MIQSGEVLVHSESPMKAECVEVRNNGGYQPPRNFLTDAPTKLDSRDVQTRLTVTCGVARRTHPMKFIQRGFKATSDADLPRELYSTSETICTTTHATLPSISLQGPRTRAPYDDPRQHMNPRSILFVARNTTTNKHVNTLQPRQYDSHVASIGFARRIRLSMRHQTIYRLGWELHEHLDGSCGRVRNIPIKPLKGHKTAQLLSDRDVPSQQNKKKRHVTCSRAHWVTAILTDIK